MNEKVRKPEPTKGSGQKKGERTSRTDRKRANILPLNSEENKREQKRDCCLSSQRQLPSLRKIYAVKRSVLLIKVYTMTKKWLGFSSMQITPYCSILQAIPVNVKIYYKNVL